MGPRSCERGKMKVLPTIDLAMKLQWGRVRVNAESKMLKAVRHIFDLASMGPRSCERGK